MELNWTSACVSNGASSVCVAATTTSILDTPVRVSLVKRGASWVSHESCLVSVGSLPTPTPHKHTLTHTLTHPPILTDCIHIVEATFGLSENIDREKDGGDERTVNLKYSHNFQVPE